MPALALGVVAAAPVAAAARTSGRSSSSRRPSSRRSGDSKNGNSRINSGRIESTEKINNTSAAAVQGSVNQRSGIGEDVDAGREQQLGVLVGAKIDNDGGDVTAPGTGGRGSGDGVSGGQAGSGRTVPVPVKRRISVQVAAAKIVDKVCFVGVSLLASWFVDDLS